MACPPSLIAKSALILSQALAIIHCIPVEPASSSDSESKITSRSSFRARQLQFDEHRQFRRHQRFVILRTASVKNPLRISAENGSTVHCDRSAGTTSLCAIKSKGRSLPEPLIRATKFSLEGSPPSI